MKKFLISIFALFYLGVASGATVHFHYCMGELLSWGLTQKSADKCSNCGMDKAESGKCCKDVQQKVKVEKVQKTEWSYQFNLVAAILSPQQTWLSFTLLNAPVFEFPLAHAPPEPQTIPVFILNRTIRI